ncbi:MAG: DUF2024 family protein [Planctomycetota bacterium]|nr:DUF2024 family protein [Planctomycetota bacterium]
MGNKAESDEAQRQTFAIIEEHLKLHPEDGRALYFGADALATLGDKERALEWAEQALVLDQDEPQTLYNVACVFCHLDEIDKALDCLERSVQSGYASLEWLQNDPDLSAIREHPRFLALLEKKR